MDWASREAEKAGEGAWAEAQSDLFSLTSYKKLRKRSQYQILRFEKIYGTLFRFKNEI